MSRGDDGYITTLPYASDNQEAAVEKPPSDMIQSLGGVIRCLSYSDMMIFSQMIVDTYDGTVGVDQKSVITSLLRVSEGIAAKRLRFRNLARIKSSRPARASANALPRKRS